MTTRNDSPKAAAQRLIEDLRAAQSDDDITAAIKSAMKHAEIMAVMDTVHEAAATIGIEAQLPPVQMACVLIAEGGKILGRAGVTRAMQSLIVDAIMGPAQPSLTAEVERLRIFQDVARRHGFNWGPR